MVSLKATSKKTTSCGFACCGDCGGNVPRSPQEGWLSSGACALMGLGLRVEDKRPSRFCFGLRDAWLQQMTRVLSEGAGAGSRPAFS